VALDDFVPASGADRLLPYVKLVKVDVLATAAETRAAIAKRLLPRGIRMLAEKVETLEMFDAARADGYSLFQGYFFCRPKTLSSVALPASRLTHLHVLADINRPDLTVMALEEIVKQEPSLQRVHPTLTAPSSGRASGLVPNLQPIPTRAGAGASPVEADTGGPISSRRSQEGLESPRADEPDGRRCRSACRSNT
jgi:hypothetical protein